jgi:protein TonB
MREPQRDPFAGGLAGAIALHVLIAAALIGAAFLGPIHAPRFGEDTSQTGAIEASMVDALPLPYKARPVEKEVLVNPTPTDIPKPPPKETTAPPPKPNDLLIKTPEKTPTKTAPTPTTAVAHPQPTPETNKAASGDVNSQIAQSMSQLKNGSATMTIQSKSFGQRFAYYTRIIQQQVNENYNEQTVDPRSAHSKSVTVIFDIDATGAPTNPRIETASGSTSLDTAAIHAIQRIDGFGPLPGGYSKLTVEYKFDFN